MGNKISENVESDLRAKGYRHSRVRQSIVEIILAKNYPLAVSELQDLLKQKDLLPNKSTVYREISTLLENGFLQQVNLGDEQLRYCLRLGDHHHHVVCTKCKRIEGVEMDSDLNSIETRLEKKTGYQIQGHMLEFFGICSGCASKL